MIPTEGKAEFHVLSYPKNSTVPRWARLTKLQISKIISFVIFSLVLVSQTSWDMNRGLQNFKVALRKYRMQWKSVMQEKFVKGALSLPGKNLI